MTFCLKMTKSRQKKEKEGGEVPKKVIILNVIQSNRRHPPAQNKIVVINFRSIPHASPGRAKQSWFSSSLKAKQNRFPATYTGCFPGQRVLAFQSKTIVNFRLSAASNNRLFPLQCGIVII